MNAAASDRDSWLRRFWFRFSAGYLALYVPIAVWNVFDWVPLDRLWTPLVGWVGRAVFRLEKPVAMVSGGSGDKLSDWIQVWCVLCLALVGALLWTWFDRERREAGRVGAVLKVVVRYTLALNMLEYGVSKVLHQQMGPPRFFRLVETYGESSPMGLLWTFMGQSWAYSAFAGGFEFVGGLLLLFRRTTALGALIVAPVMLHVFLLNLCFDVPVKLFSLHLLIFAVVLCAADVRRIFDLLVLRRPVAPAPAHVPWLHGRPARLLGLLKALIVIAILWLIPGTAVSRWLSALPPGKNAALYGLYDVDVFSVDGVPRPPLLTDPLRWKQFAIEHETSATLVRMDGTRSFVTISFGPSPDTLTIGRPNAQSPAQVVTLTRAESGKLHLEGRRTVGELSGKLISIELRRADENKLLLRNRGFRWISETPFNR